MPEEGQSWKLEPLSLVRGSISKEKMERDPGRDRGTVVTIGQPNSPTTVQTGPKRCFQGPITTTGSAQLALHGSPWVYVLLPLTPNDHPTKGQGSQGVAGGHPKIAILQPTHMPA